MARRVSLPAADDLFRPTADRAPAAEEEQPVPAAAPASAPAPAPAPAEQAESPRQPSGRVRHDEKMTVYVTSEELLAIEQARLVLRSRHRLAVDRGRLVREAVAMVLADLDELGEDSRLVRRLEEG